jgi:hypothetical protein
MNKNRLSYYASFVAIACGVLILIMSFFVKPISTFNVVMVFIFIGIGVFGVKMYQNK